MPTKWERLLEKILEGHSDRNIDFDSLCNLLLRLGFDERVQGSHHVFTKFGVQGRINLQPIGAKAKAYQVAQVREALKTHGLIRLP